MLKPKGNVVTVLDIGSSKIICMVARIKNDGRIEILGVGHKQTEGLKGGHVTNAKQLVKCLLSAMDDAEQTSAADISNVYVCISGFNLRSHYRSVETIVNGNEINDKNTKILLNKCSEHLSEDNSHVVIHAIPIQYKLDENDGIVDPRGMYGNVLSANFHIVTAAKSSLVNLAHCISRCHVNVAGYIASSYASGIACLSPDEKKLGVSLIDIGGGCVTIGVFESDNLVFNATIPIGGFHITKDIASGLSTTIAEAEKIKVLRGIVLVTAMDRNEPIEVTSIVGGGSINDAETNYITKEALTNIIRPRAEEIIELAMEKLKIAGQRFPCAHRIVLTGGTSKLGGLKELIGHLAPETRARTGYANIISDSSLLDITDPGFSTSLGSLMFLRDTFFADVRSSEDSGNVFSVRRIVDWIKEKVEL